MSSRRGEGLSEWAARRQAQLVFDSAQGRAAGRFFGGTVAIRRNGITRKYRSRIAPDGISRATRVTRCCEAMGWTKHDGGYYGPLVFTEEPGV